MIGDSIKNNSSKPNLPKHKGIWAKILMAFAIITTTAWLILFLFSNLLFSTAIKRVFLETTNQEYSIDFKNLRINILTLKITFYQTLIKRTENFINQEEQNINFYSDTLAFQNINLFAFAKNKILKFKNISLSNCEIEIEKQNSKAEQKNLLLPLNNYIEAIKILNFEVSNAKIKYSQENDSLFIPALNFKLQDFKIDSLTDTVINNRFHFEDIYLHLKNQQLYLPDKSHLLSWENLELSSKEKYFELNNFNIKPSDTVNNKQSYTVDIPIFRLEHFDIDSLLDKKQLISKNLLLEINFFNIRYNKTQNKSENLLFKEQIEAFFANKFDKIVIDSVSITVNKSKINLLNNKQLNFNGKSYLSLEHFKFEPKNIAKYSLREAELLINSLIFNDFKNKQEVNFNLGQLNYNKQTLNIIGVNVISGSKKESKLHLKEVQLEGIDWNQLLNDNKLLAENLCLTSGDLVQLKIPKSNTFSDKLDDLNSITLPILKSVKIKTIQFKDWNYNLPSKGILAKNIDAEIAQFQLPNNSKLAFGIFSNFNSKINQFSWVSKDQKHHYLANNLALNSQSQNISINKIQSFPRWKSLKNELLDDDARFKVFGKNIKIITQKPFHQIRFNDTLSLSKLVVDSLNLKQFGKTIAQEKLKSSPPPILISLFELRKGEFTAYNDSSIVSRLAQVNGIHLRGDSIEIYSDSLFIVNYRHLIAITKNGFYQNKAQGLSFDFKKIDFDSENETMELHQFYAEIASNNNDKSTQHQLNSKLVQVRGFDYSLFLQRNLISAQEFTINSPSLISKTISGKKQSQIDFRNLFSLQNFEQIPYLEFDRFIISDFSWFATYTVNGITNTITFEKANFEAVDFRLSHRSFTNPERIFFSKSTDFHIGNFKQNFRNGNYYLMIDNIGFSSLQKQINFDKIQFYTLQKENQNYYNFTIDRISFNQINFADFQSNFNFTADNILIQRPNAKLRFLGFDESSTANNLDSLKLYPILQPFFSQITINNIDVRDMTLRLDVPKDSSTNIYNLGKLNLKMQDFRLDSTTKAFKNNRFLYSQNMLIHLRDYSAQITNDLYRFYFADLRLSTLRGIINIDSVSLKPQYDYADFAQRVKHQTDRFDIEISNIKLSGIDFQDALFRQKYIVQRADVNHLNGEIYRDGQYPRLPDFYPPNPIQRLLDLPYFIQIDSLLINDSYLAYKEKGKHTEVPGHIYFDKLNALILNASNNPDFIKFGGNTVLNAQTLLMGKSKLVLDVNFPLFDQGKSFKLYAHLNRIEMDDLDPVLRPLALIQARSGTIKSIELSVEANDDYAFGNMLMYYDNMKVEILNKSMKKGFFGTLFANAMIKTENPSYLIPRKGPIYFERNKMRSIFNYWAEISILGMKTSMGLADRRIAKKVKKLQEK
ncbi:MAG: hypothetical protein PF484_14390 [Bacteroidales bacterium]|jgi:hypothetical protein|nr:hypothetical protein [Bacteroidales bacterium]